MREVWHVLQRLLLETELHYTRGPDEPLVQELCPRRAQPGSHIAARTRAGIPETGRQWPARLRPEPGGLSLILTGPDIGPLTGSGGERPRA